MQDMVTNVFTACQGCQSSVHAIYHNMPTIGCGNQCGPTGPKDGHAAVAERTFAALNTGGMTLSATFGMLSLSATYAPAGQIALAMITPG